MVGVAAHFPREEINKVIDLLKTTNRIVILTHHRPDGDAIGSQLALYHYLLQKNQQTAMIVPSGLPDFLQWMPAANQIINFENNSGLAQQKISNAEIIFCLDFNWLSRLENLENFVRRSAAKKILIDHHLQPENVYDIVFSYPESSATAELIYEFIVAMGDKDLINKTVAECIYTGIMTDTQSFRFSTMTSGTHRIIADLIERGVENNKIHENVYDNFSENRIRFLGYCIREKLQVLPQYNTAYISISKKELEQFNHHTGDTEGIVNFALGIKGIRLAAFFSERAKDVKISLRSKNEFSVQELAVKYFEGGGHKNAAGGTSHLPLQETIKKFEEILPLYEKELSE